MACEKCPCPDGCKGPPTFCEWASAPEPDPVRIEHIRVKGGCSKQPEFPPITRQVANAAGAVLRLAGAIIEGVPVRVSGDVLEQRKAMCDACEHRDRERDRCRKCGCWGLKLELATERCPLDPPRWGRWSPEPADG